MLQTTTTTTATTRAQKKASAGKLTEKSYVGDFNWNGASYPLSNNKDIDLLRHPSQTSLYHQRPERVLPNGIISVGRFSSMLVCLPLA